MSTEGGKVIGTGIITEVYHNEKTDQNKISNKFSLDDLLDK